MSLQPPSVYQGRVFAGSDNLYVFDFGGNEKWQKKIKLSSLPIGIDDTLVIGSEDGNLYGLNLEGKEIWRMELDAPVYATIDDEHIYAASGVSCYCISMETKEVLWAYKTGGIIGY